MPAAVVTALEAEWQKRKAEPRRLAQSRAECETVTRILDETVPTAPDDLISMELAAQDVEFDRQQMQKARDDLAVVLDGNAASERAVSAHIQEWQAQVDARQNFDSLMRWQKLIAWFKHEVPEAVSADAQTRIDKLNEEFAALRVERTQQERTIAAEYHRRDQFVQLGEMQMMGRQTYLKELRAWARQHGRAFAREDALLHEIAERRGDIREAVRSVLTENGIETEGWLDMRITAVATNALIFADTYGGSHQSLQDAITNPTLRGQTRRLEEVALARTAGDLLAFYEGRPAPVYEVDYNSFDEIFTWQDPIRLERNDPATCWGRPDQWTAAAVLRRRELNAGIKAIPYGLHTDYEKYPDHDSASAAVYLAGSVSAAAREYETRARTWALETLRVAPERGEGIEPPLEFQVPRRFGQTTDELGL